MTAKATGPRVGFAGVSLEATSVRLRLSMAMVSSKRPRSFDRWEFSVMVGLQGSDEKGVRRGRNEEINWNPIEAQEECE